MSLRVLQHFLKQGADIGTQVMGGGAKPAGAPAVAPIKPNLGTLTGGVKAMGSIVGQAIRPLLPFSSSKNKPAAPRAPAAPAAAAGPTQAPAQTERDAELARYRGALGGGTAAPAQKPAAAPAAAPAAPAPPDVRATPASQAERQGKTPEQIQQMHQAWAASPEYKQMLAKNYALNGAQAKAPGELQPYMGAATAALSKPATPPIAGKPA